MESLRFEKDEGLAFYKTFRERVQQYFQEQNISRKANTQMWFKVGLYFGLIVATYLIAMLTQNAPIFFTAYIASGIFVVLSVFNIAHDAAHGTISKRKSVNSLLYKISFNLLGNNAYIWRKYHTESHHLYTNVEGSDIDVLANPMLRMTHEQKHRKIHRYQQYYAPVLYLFYSLAWTFFRDIAMLFGKTDRSIEIKLPAAEVAKLILSKMVYVTMMLVLPIAFTPFTAGAVILAFFLMHFTISLMICAVLGVSHLSDRVAHPTPEQEGQLSLSWPSLQLITSLDYHSESRFLNFTLGGFNAHTLHHLLPTVCHVHYPKLVSIFHDTADEYGLPYNELRFGEAIASHFRFLKNLGHAA